MTKVSLPTVEGEIVFPTGKPHVSFSEVHDWIECSWRHKKKHIEKIDLDGPSIHTEFGQVVHDAMEAYILLSKDERKPIDPAPYVEDFKKRTQALIDKMSDEKLAAKTTKDMADFATKMPPLLEDAPKWLDEQFPGWEAVAAEEKLYESIEGQKVKFKGFVDAFIKFPKRRKKRRVKPKGEGVRLSDLEPEYEIVEGEWDYYVLDWKTCDWGWKAEKKRDFNKQLQIMLYKIFYCEKLGLGLKDVKCGFVLLKRKPNKKTGSHCELITVSVGPKAVEKSIMTLNTMINQVNKGLFLKNRKSCMFCRFKNTEHCT